MGTKIYHAITKLRDEDTTMETLSERKEGKERTYPINPYARYRHFYVNQDGRFKVADCYKKFMLMLSSINIHVTRKNDYISLSNYNTL